MPRNKTRGIFALIVVLSIFATGCSNDAQTATKNNNQNSPAFGTVYTGSMEAGDSVIEITPKGIENGKFIVDISLNTHSVDLSQYDLMEITTLQYNDKKINPESSPKLTGHHNSGTMVFDIGKVPENFSITITGIPNIENRMFEWP